MESDDKLTPQELEELIAYFDSQFERMHGRFDEVYKAAARVECVIASLYLTPPDYVC